jgi:peptide/nickel transport system substrate-binding protein
MAMGLILLLTIPLGATMPVRVGATTLPDSMDPTKAWHQLQFLAINCTLDTLVRKGAGGKITSGLAKKWEIQNSGKTYIFELQNDKIFHDGSPVTSQDVAYSISRHFWPSSKSFVKESLSPLIAGANTSKEGKIISGIRTPDRGKLVIELNDQFPQLLSTLSMPGFGIMKLGTGETQFVVGSGPMTAVLDRDLKAWNFVPFAGYKGLRSTSTPIVFRKIENYKNLLSLLSKGEIDLSLGFADPELNATSIPKGFKLRRIDTPGFLHMFLNLENSKLKDDFYRKNLAGLIKYAFDQVASPGFFIENLDVYLPPGLMPQKYYNRKGVRVTPEEFKQKFQSTIELKPLRIFLRKEYLNPELVNVLEKTLSQAGVLATVKTGYISELFPKLSEGSYDMLMMGYFGLTPDPEGFVDPLNERSVPRYGIVPTKALFEKFNSARAISLRVERLKKYSEILIDFESKDFLVPLYRLYLPAIKSDQLNLPDTNFRYDLDLTRITRTGAL